MMKALVLTLLMFTVLSPQADAGKRDFCSGSELFEYDSVISQLQETNPRLASVIKSTGDTLVQFSMPSAGTGFVISKSGTQGIILTASHVARIEKSSMDSFTDTQFI